MEVVGDSIAGIWHDGGVDVEGVVLDKYVIQLESGRCIQLEELGVEPATVDGLHLDENFNWCIGLNITALLPAYKFGPNCSLHLSNDRVIFMGSPAPYYFGLEDADVNSPDE